MARGPVLHVRPVMLLRRYFDGASVSRPVPQGPPSLPQPLCPGVAGTHQYRQEDQHARAHLAGRQELSARQARRLPDLLQQVRVWGREIDGASSVHLGDDHWICVAFGDVA